MIFDILQSDDLVPEMRTQAGIALELARRLGTPSKLPQQRLHVVGLVNLSIPLLFEAQVPLLKLPPFVRGHCSQQILHLVRHERGIGTRFQRRFKLFDVYLREEPLLLHRPHVAQHGFILNGLGRGAVEAPSAPQAVDAEAAASARLAEIADLEAKLAARRMQKDTSEAHRQAVHAMPSAPKASGKRAAKKEEKAGLLEGVVSSS